MKTSKNVNTRKTTRTSTRILCMMAALVMVFSALAAAVVPASAAGTKVAPFTDTHYAINDTKGSFKTVYGTLKFSTGTYWLFGNKTKVTASITVDFGDKIFAVQGAHLFLIISLSDGTAIYTTIRINSNVGRGNTQVQLKISDEKIGTKSVVGVSARLMRDCDYKIPSHWKMA